MMVVLGFEGCVKNHPSLIDISDLTVNWDVAGDCS